MYLPHHEGIVRMGKGHKSPIFGLRCKGRINVVVVYHLHRIKLNLLNCEPKLTPGTGIDTFAMVTIMLVSHLSCLPPQ